MGVLFGERKGIHPILCRFPQSIARVSLMTETVAGAEEMPDARYDFEGIDLESGSVHAHVVKLVGPSRRVLELGPATGYMSRVLVERDCTVVGIEFDPKMAERAAESCDRVIVGDLDSLDLADELGDDRFDVIVAADVLEHLKDPLGALRRLRAFLKPDGCFVISIPNVAHGSIRLALLLGQFEYQPRGLLDSTHLRFFTRETFEQLLFDAELGFDEFLRYEVDIAASEVGFDETAVTTELVKQLEQEPDARTYQFIVRVVPMHFGGLRGIQTRLRKLAEARLREAQMSATLNESQRQSGQFEADLGVLRGEIEDLRAANLRLQMRLDRISASRPFRFYSTLRGLPGLRSMRRGREAAFEAMLEQRSGGDARD